ncbi:MAG: MBL fold metallo-hydrolase [Phycisphaeraceae bacterium]|nr:MBL fold metallo-hydrolase [Phycisphaeraceae bacterium]
MPTPQPRIDAFTLGDWQTNCYLVTAHADAAEPAACWIIDCGFDPGPMLDAIRDRDLRPAAIILTHAHVDHIGGVEEIRARFPEAPVLLHEAERGFCSDPLLNLSAFVGMHLSCREPDRLLRGGEILELEDTRWRVLHVPGHSPGGIALVHDASGTAVVGDTLFQGSIGRSDFPTSDPDLLRTSLERLMELPDGTRVFPGHGPPTSIGAERRTNPFLRGGW